MWDGRLAEAIEYALETGLDRISEERRRMVHVLPGTARTTSRTGARRSGTRRPCIGLPMGDYPHSRPPQGILPEAAKEQIRTTFESVGFAKQLADA